ncbi:MAG: ribonucleoside-diphosphate reductase, adenosylcobalamin-dependent [Candidatus Kerfeldbacteria bacterium RIFOXYA2_FULL_38_24]|uniref:Vitamin B12-dependent ribonucleotide reductase n=1 Tax=Candidatus Kerfeldbacteria bacterium RIFOXYB2_FULL_38_14 TaxID=1798547 RepID=A0A1G2BGR9_9BACT|nr:MAG: ribonucleoside-diphosphate reductase, adenosylcobalamin-dependent [Candidatus Kerfeldbacteria bacterium RIFOXYA2_FULL_38_24]OGY88255.1 MAG: ribonucleoside-diphosphate reductase, adenosylcobalamin-dependent [Candidatus Kerfeldbacteria bacterium RIFOXYB2_FULL_38_14]
MGQQLNELREKVFYDRYALKDEKGQRLENTPEEMWTRVAKAIAKIEDTPSKKQEWEKKFYAALTDFKFVPGGRILKGAGTNGELTFYNCYVIPSPDDSRGGILDSVRIMVEIMSRGGGVGVNLSTLRPRGAYVTGVNGTASGAVSFGGLYSYATGLIIQGGSRRGALMLMLNDDHPDVEEFITVKKKMDQITNANLSVCVSDRFMEAVQNNADWDLKWHNKVYKTIKAKDLWNSICESAHACGEPGVVFMERMNKESNSWYFEDLVCVNPCGEQPLPTWGVCNLGAINLAAFVQAGRFNKDLFKETVHTAIRFLDNVVDSTPYFFKENKAVQERIRRTGLGTMGLADALIKMKIRYGSEEAIAWCEEIYQFLRDEAYQMSVQIAKEKGPFPAFDSQKFLQGKFMQRLPQALQTEIRQFGIRNGVLLTQAPTGTTSIVSGVSSGIEPVFDFAFKRKDRLGEHIVYHPLYEAWKKANPEADETDKPDYFVSAKELAPLAHVKMQAVAQKYTDASISKTVNAPHDHSVEAVQDLYLQAYQLGCKGIAYYREGSRNISVLESLDKKTDTKTAPAKSVDKKSVDAVSAPATPAPRIRPEVLSGLTYKIKTGYGTLYVTINQDDQGKPFEIFATTGKAGGFFAAKSEAICRLASLALRSGIPAENIIDQLKGIRGPMTAWGKNGQVLSIADAIAQVLSTHITSAQEQLKLKYNEESALGQNKTIFEEAIAVDAQATTTATAHPQSVNYSASIADNGFAPECPDCGNILAMAEGCMTCHACGYSKCT